MVYDQLLKRIARSLVRGKALKIDFPAAAAVKSSPGRTHGRTPGRRVAKALKTRRRRALMVNGYTRPLRPRALVFTSAPRANPKRYLKSENITQKKRIKTNNKK